MRQQTQKPKIFFVGSALALSRPSLLIWGAKKGKIENEYQGENL